MASCVINDKLYNAAPSGWRFFAREFGEIGGSSVRVTAEGDGGSVVERFCVFDRALMTSECIALK